MVKKESAIRGYMTQEEVEKHLENLSSEEGKINYLKEVSAKKGLLAPETQKNVYRTLAKTYVEKHEADKAGDILMNLGGEDYGKGLKLLENWKSMGSAEVLEKHGELKAAAKVYRSLYHEWKNWTGDQGKKSEAAVEKAIELYEKTGDFDSAGWLTIDSMAGLYSKSDSKKLEYAAVLERVADKTEDNHYKVRFLENAQRRYESAGKGVKAASLGKKIATLKTEKGDLVARVAPIAGVAGVLGGLFLLSPNLTGNAIANVSQNSSNVFGAILLVAGIIAGYFYFKK